MEILLFAILYRNAVKIREKDEKKNTHININILHVYKSNNKKSTQLLSGL